MIALSLTCAVSSSACKKHEDAPIDVDHEGSHKPKPVVLEKRDWIPGPASSIPKGRCESSFFCTTAPEITNVSDASALMAECGSSAKIPEAVAEKGFAGRNAYFSDPKTREEREQQPRACCFAYQTRPCGKGRPLRHEGELVLASESRRDDWSDALAMDFGAFDPAEIASLVVHLRRVALLEHASVAAFARVSLELLTLGAPSDLVEAAHRAALDEVRHAKLCWSVLAALDGQQRGPSPMNIPGAHSNDPEQILIATVIEGCVSETLGSLLFAEAARQCTVPELARVYRVIADEEAEHAALAFRIVQFLAREDPSRTDRALEAAASAPRDDSDTPAIPSLGMLDRAAQREVLDRGYREVVLPTLIALRPTSLRSGSRDGRVDGDTSDTSRVQA